MENIVQLNLRLISKYYKDNNNLNYFDIIILYYICKNIVGEEEKLIYNDIEGKNINDYNPFQRIYSIKTINKLPSKDNLVNKNNMVHVIKTALNIIKGIMLYFYPSKLNNLNNIIQKNYNYKNNQFIFGYNISEKNLDILEKEIKSISYPNNNSQILKIAKTHIMIIVNFIKFIMKDSLFNFKILNPFFLSNKTKTFNFFGYFEGIEKEIENCFNNGSIIDIHNKGSPVYPIVRYFHVSERVFLINDRIYIFLIGEKNLILIILKNEIRIYDIKGKNLFCKINHNLLEDYLYIDHYYYHEKFFKLNNELFLVVNYIRDKIYYIKINYDDSSKNPKSITILEDNFFKSLGVMISNLEIIDNNNIICVGENHIFFIGQKKK